MVGIRCKMLSVSGRCRTPIYVKRHRNVVAQAPFDKTCIVFFLHLLMYGELVFVCSFFFSFAILLKTSFCGIGFSWGDTSDAPPTVYEQGNERVLGGFFFFCSLVSRAISLCAVYDLQYVLTERGQPCIAPLQSRIMTNN